MSITYIIAIDLNHDGDYADLAEAITADILEVRWRLGMKQAYQHRSENSFAEIIVRNRSGVYSPERSNSLVGCFVRIQSDDGTTTRTHFLGVLAFVEPEAGLQGSQQSRIIVYGREAELAQNLIHIPAMVNARADEVLDTIFPRLKLRYEGVNQYCIIGREGYNLIDSTIIFPADPVTKSFEAGKSIFSYIGDQWGEGIPADEAIRQIAEGEGGYFFFDRSGQAIFYNRHHLMLNTTTQATFTDDMQGLDYRYGSDRITQVQVRLTPRTIGADHTKIWSLLQPTRIRNGQSRTITARYTLDNRPVGLLSGIEMDYLARLDSDPSSQDVTGLVDVVIHQENFSAAVIEVRNLANADIYLHALNLYGRPLITGDQMNITEFDHMAAALYGHQSQVIEQDVLTNIDEAAAIAQDELRRHSTPQGSITEIYTSTKSHPDEVLGLTLYDRIRVIESQTGQDRFYRIIAEEHSIDRGGNRHRVGWLLQPDDSETFFVIGLHNIDGDQVIALR